MELKMTKRGYWPTLNEKDGQKWGNGGKNADAPYEAFRRSCKAIVDMWQGSLGNDLQQKLF